MRDQLSSKDQLEAREVKRRELEKPVIAIVVKIAGVGWPRDTYGYISMSSCERGGRCDGSECGYGSPERVAGLPAAAATGAWASTYPRQWLQCEQIDLPPNKRYIQSGMYTTETFKVCVFYLLPDIRSFNQNI